MTTTTATTVIRFGSPAKLSAGISLADLYFAYLEARVHTRNSRSQVRFERSLGRNLCALYRDIISGRYRPGRSACFIIKRPVKREVFAAPFRDRVVHHLLFRWLNPYFEPTFIHDSYACRKGKGTLFGIERLEHHIRSVSENYTKPCYVLQLDILGHFMSIDRTLVLDVITDRLKARRADERPSFNVLYDVLSSVVLNNPVKGCIFVGHLSDYDGVPVTKQMRHAKAGCGLAIGNLTLQLFSNILLDLLDQYVKRVLKQKHYGRYVDDFYIVGRDKAELLSLVSPIRDFLRDRLHLTLHPRKIRIREQHEGISFLGYVLKDGRRRLTRRARVLMDERLSEVLSDEKNPYVVRMTVNSYRGHLAHAGGAQGLMRGVKGF